MWIEIEQQADEQISTYRHSLRGSVDWNFLASFIVIKSPVTPYAGVWIEIIFEINLSIAQLVTPYAGVWIEIVCIGMACVESACHSLRGSVDWNF